LQELEDRGRAIATREHEEKSRPEQTSASLEEDNESSEEDMSDKEMYEVA
jgi:hypothetical protein